MVCLFQTSLTSNFGSWAHSCLRLNFQNRASASVLRGNRKLWSTGLGRNVSSSKCQILKALGQQITSFSWELVWSAVGEGSAEHRLWLAAEKALIWDARQWNINSNVLPGKHGFGYFVFPAVHRRVNWQQYCCFCHLSESRCGEK